MLIYTFTSFPDKVSLYDIAEDVFVFSNHLKDDMERFKQLLIEKFPEHILGVAKSKGKSRYEPVAVNHFHKGTVIKGGTEELKLWVPDSRIVGLEVASRPPRTFCNWTAYHVQSFISKELPDSTFSFLHLNPNDRTTFIEGILTQE